MPATLIADCIRFLAMRRAGGDDQSVPLHLFFLSEYVQMGEDMCGPVFSGTLLIGADRHRRLDCVKEVL